MKHNQSSAVKDINPGRDMSRAWKCTSYHDDVTCWYVLYISEGTYRIECSHDRYLEAYMRSGQQI